MESRAQSHSSHLPSIVLLVDQRGEIGPAYAPFLESSGVWVSTSQLPEAFEATQDLRPDLIVTDVDLAEASEGYRFVAGLTMAPAVTDIPLIALTDDRAYGALPPLARMRATRCLVKPVLPPALLADVQQILLQGYGSAIRADRESTKLRELTDRARALIPVPGSTPDSASLTRPCPSCGFPLTWSENRDLAGDSYDYYEWCANRCGLFCYTRQSGQWLKLAASPHGEAPAFSQPSLASARGIRVVTDRQGCIVTVEADGAALLNVSSQHAAGSSLLRFIEDGRLQLAEDLRRVGHVTNPRRSVTLRPRDRKPRRVTVSLFEEEQGIVWMIEAEPTLIVPARRRKRTA
jgi:CheY-like chemotaxis protein